MKEGEEKWTVKYPETNGKVTLCVTSEVLTTGLLHIHRKNEKKKIMMIIIMNRQVLWKILQCKWQAIICLLLWHHFFLWFSQRSVNQSDTLSCSYPLTKHWWIYMSVKSDNLFNILQITVRSIWCIPFLRFFLMLNNSHWLPI